MKKVLSAVTVVCFSLMLCFQCLAAGNIILSVKPTDPVDGGDCAAAVEINPSSKLCTVEFTLGYDSQLLEYKKDSAALGNAAENVSPYFSVTEKEKGLLYICYTGTEPLEDGGVLCTLDFKSRAKENTQAKIEIKVDHAETFDGEHIRRLECTANSAQIAVKSAQNRFNTPAIVVACSVTLGAAIVIIFVKRKIRHNEK